MRVGRAEMHEVVKPSFREYRVFPFFFILSLIITDVLLSVA